MPGVTYTTLFPRGRAAAAASSPLPLYCLQAALVLVHPAEQVFVVLRGWRSLTARSALPSLGWLLGHGECYFAWMLCL